MPRDLPPPGRDRALQSGTVFEATKACVAKLFTENGGHKCVIDRFGVSLRRAYNFTESGNDEQISFARVAALTSPTATAAARYLATLAGGVFRPLPVRDETAPLAALGSAARSHGNTIAEAVNALADHRITRAELAAIEREGMAAIADLAALLGSVRAMAEVPSK